MHWSLYLRKNKLYIPSVAQTEAGFYLEVDPVDVIDRDDCDGVCAAVSRVLAMGNPIIPTPTRAAFPKWVILKYSGVRSHSVFEREAEKWSIQKDSHRYVLRHERRHAEGGWGEEPLYSESLPDTISIEDLGRRIFLLIKSNT
jgi:hypothetical protein